MSQGYMSVQFDKQVILYVQIETSIPDTCNTCFVVHTLQFIRPTRDTFIRIFNENGNEVFSINAKTSGAVTYPSDAMDHALI